MPLAADASTAIPSGAGSLSRIVTARAVVSIEAPVAEVSVTVKVSSGSSAASLRSGTLIGRVSPVALRVGKFTVPLAAE
jgi:hypothetical protein